MSAQTPWVAYEGSLVNATTRRYQHADQQGSITAYTDAVGNALFINTYDPYGVPGANNNTRFQYTGQIFLPDVALYYYKARFYNPHLGRFMQTDPIGYKDDLDLYTYVGNDPFNKTDPTGTESRPEKDKRAAEEEARKAAEGSDLPMIAQVTHMGDPTNPNYPGVGAAQAAAGTLLVGGIAVVAGSKIAAAAAASKVVIQFGKVENQVSHTFRHIEKIGLSRNVVQEAIKQDISKASVTGGQPARVKVVVASFTQPTAE